MSRSRSAAILHRLALAVRRALLTTALALVTGSPAAPAQAHTLATAPTAVTAAVTEPCPGDPIRIDQLTTGSFESSLQGSLRARAVRRPGRDHGGAREVLLRPARGCRRRQRSTSAPHARPGDLRPARLPRLGRLEPSRRHALARGLLDRGRVPRQAQGPRAGQDHARLPARPGRPGRWFAELGLAAIAGARSATPTTASPGASRSSTPATRRSPTSRTADPLLHEAQRRRPAGTPATCTSTPSTPRSATRPCARPSATPSGRPSSTSSRSPTTSRLGVGRDRPLQDRPPPSRRALLGGHHLPRPHEQPAVGPLRRLPHRPGLRARTPTAG